jgi:signal transduction histidine kinase
VDIALRQNPHTKRLLLITGSSPADHTGVPELVGALKDKFRREAKAIKVETLEPMTYAATRRYLSGVPNDTVCVFVFYYVDSAGEVLSPARVLPEFSRVSTRPIYSGWDIDVGRGSVGGRVISVPDIGQALAGQAARVLRGEEPSRIPPVRDDFQHYRFDWRQMKRWGIRMDQLPAGSSVINREYTVWELYKWQILGGIALILVQTLLIVVLVRSYVARRRAARHVAFQHMLTSIMAELSAAFLNLPSEVINAEVDSALKRLLDAFTLDRISVFEFSPDGQRLHRLFAKTVAGTTAPPAEVDARGLTWLMQELASNRRVVASRLEELPPAAEALKQFAQKLDIRSVAIFPLHCDGVTFGKLTCSAVRREIAWTPDMLEYLQSVADLFGSALRRRRAEEALASSERLKASILSSLNTEIAVVDRSGRIMASNDQWQAHAKEHGGRPDWIGRVNGHFELCQGCEDACQPARAVLEGMQQVWEGGRESFEMEYECRPESGERRWFLMTVTPLRGPSSGAVISHHDISESRRNEEAIRTLSGKLITAQEEERARIARELHDDINQQLALLAIDLQQVEKNVSKDAGWVRAQMHELWKKTTDISADIQRLSHQLHSSRLDHLGLVSALRGLCQEFARQQQMGIDFQSRNVPSNLDREVALTLFRITQECLRNVGKHSQAQQVNVEVMGDGNDLVLRVSDDGAGFNTEAPPRGLGMVSMQERLRLVGGRLTVRSREPRGTQVEARVPLPAQPEDPIRSQALTAVSGS